jgi:hypothetical protein
MGVHIVSGSEGDGAGGSSDAVVVSGAGAGLLMRLPGHVLSYSMHLKVTCF